MRDKIRVGVTANDSFWGAELVSDLRSEEHFIDNFVRQLIFSIGLDPVECFKNSDYKVTPVGLKCWSLDQEERTCKEFIIITTLIPNDAKNYQTYLIPTFEEFNEAANGILIRNHEAGEDMQLRMEIRTCECDGHFFPSISEHNGHAGRIPCHRCMIRGETNANGRGSYPKGYISREAFNADRKNNQEMRQISIQVANGEANGTEYGIKQASVFAKMLPNFDIVYGFLIEFLHKIFIVFPRIFWKEHILRPYKSTDQIEFYQMPNDRRKIFHQRIKSIRTPHDMKQLKDPNSESLRADEWLDFIITASIEAADGLVEPRMMRIWKLIRAGIIIYLNALTDETRRMAIIYFQEAGKLLEELQVDKLSTLAVHQLLVEADKQIDVTGPIKESMGWWVERMCKSCVEPTIRRRVSAAPDKTIMRSILVKHMLFSYEKYIPDITEFLPEKNRNINKIEDEGTVECKFLGYGDSCQLSTEEFKYVKQFLLAQEVITKDETFQLNVVKFRRSFFKSEIHSSEYAKVQSKSSTNVAVQFIDDFNEIKTYYAQIEKFFLFDFKGETYRVAYLRVFYPLPLTAQGTERINRNREYKLKGKVVEIQAIDRKVVFYGSPGDTRVLEVPFHVYLLRFGVKMTPRTTRPNYSKFIQYLSNYKCNPESTP